LIQYSFRIIGLLWTYRPVTLKVGHFSLVKVVQLEPEMSAIFYKQSIRH
jgi:hypothetical protein